MSQTVAKFGLSQPLYERLVEAAELREGTPEQQAIITTRERLFSFQGPMARSYAQSMDSLPMTGLDIQLKTLVTSTKMVFMMLLLMLLKPQVGQDMLSSSQGKIARRSTLSKQLSRMHSILDGD